jgi:hypothetical protein
MSEGRHERRDPALWLLHTAGEIDNLLAELDRRLSHFHVASNQVPREIGGAVTGVARAEGMRAAIDEIIDAHRFEKPVRCLKQEIADAITRCGYTPKAS